MKSAKTVGVVGREHLRPCSLGRDIPIRSQTIRDPCLDKEGMELIRCEIVRPLYSAKGIVF